MNRGSRALTLALVGVGLVGLGVGAPPFVSRGAAQDSSGNRLGETAAPPAPPAPDTPQPGSEAAPPPEAAPTVAPAASDDADAKVDSNEASDDDAASPPPAAPLVRPRYTTAVLQALDKVTAETLRFEAKVGEPVRYKDLVLTVRDCEATAANEAPKDSIVNMDVQYQPAVLGGGAEAVRQVFQGWMFANSPGLHPFANPIYDVWVIACKTPAPAPPPPAAPAPAPANGGGASL